MDPKNQVIMKNPKNENGQFWLNANLDNLEMINSDQMKMLKGGGDGDGVVIEDVITD